MGSFRLDGFKALKVMEDSHTTSICTLSVPTYYYEVGTQWDEISTSLGTLPFILVSVTRSMYFLHWRTATYVYT